MAPLSVVRARAIGALRMRDMATGDDRTFANDEKIIAVPVPRLTRRYEKVHNYLDLPDITLKQIEHFFEHYKDIENGKWVKVKGWDGIEAAKKVLVDGAKRFADGQAK